MRSTTFVYPQLNRRARIHQVPLSPDLETSMTGRFQSVAGYFSGDIVLTFSIQTVSKNSNFIKIADVICRHRGYSVVQLPAVLFHTLPRAKSNKKKVR